MKIFLVRHLEYDNPQNIFPYHLPVTLSLEGRKRARQMATWFAEQKLGDLPIYTSPIVRTVQTAEIIAAETLSPVYIDEDLIEVISEQLQGKAIPENGDWSECYLPGMQEEPKSILQRMLNSFFRHMNEGRDCILVSHGDNLTLLYNNLSSKGSQRALDQTSSYLDKGEFIEVEIRERKVVGIRRHHI